MPPFPIDDLRFIFPEPLRDLLWDPVKGSPRNRPAPFAAIMAGMYITALSHYVPDEKVGQQIRSLVANGVIASAAQDHIRGESDA